MSIFDQHGDVSVAPSWRCPHCRTLQAESSSCWRCSRSALTCSTCHLFRRAVVSGLGYCAADRANAPLGGDEVHACWQARPQTMSAPGLFAADEVGPAPALLVPDAVQPAPVRKEPRSTVPAAKPPLEDIRAAAWAHVPQGALVDAPRVEPGRQVMTEVKRRRLWRR